MIRTDRKNPSATKSGPGRYHQAGHQKMARASTPVGFRPVVGDITYTRPTGVNERRAAIKAAGSFRQYKRARMAPLRAARASLTA